jgi:hypothetical protein
VKRLYRTRYANGRPGQIHETLGDAITAAALSHENVEMTELDGGRLRLHVGPLTLGHIEPCESGAN